MIVGLSADIIRSNSTLFGAQELMVLVAVVPVAQVRTKDGGCVGFATLGCTSPTRS